MTDFRIPVEQRGWQHNICLYCWKSRCKERGELGRKPIRIKNAGIAHCCFCSRGTNDGILVREDPKSEKLNCVEKHD
jgi:hypothetical protein